MKKGEIANLRNFLIVCLILMILVGFLSFFKTDESSLTGGFVKLITGKVSLQKPYHIVSNPDGSGRRVVPNSPFKSDKPATSVANTASGSDYCRTITDVGRQCWIDGRVGGLRGTCKEPTPGNYQCLKWKEGPGN